MDYVIKNYKNVYIRINENGRAVTCTEQDKTLFEYSKAKNILGCLPKTLKRLNFRVEAIPDISSEINPKQEKTELEVIQKEDYTPSENVMRWIDKFGICDDILTEAKKRKEELCVALSNQDRELSNELHRIELENNKNACQGFYEYKRIKYILECRRDIKDELMIISNVLKMDFRCLNSENVKKAVSGLANRKFTLRFVEEEEESVM